MTFKLTTNCLFFLLIALQLGYIAFYFTPMFAALDDVMYMFGARSFAEQGDFYLLNGYEKYKSTVLSYWDFFMEAPNGKLVTQYPPFYSMLGSPFYMLFGEFGLYYFNCILFYTSIYLVYRIAALYFKNDDNYARIAAAIYGFGGFAWLLSILALSHLCGLVFILLAFYLVYKPFVEKTEYSPIKLIIIGTLLGFATGVRYDSIFFLPIICYGFVYFYPKIRYKYILLVVAGYIPWMAVLGYINYLKYGEFSPLSYGTNTLSDINTPNIFYPSFVFLAFFFFYQLYLKKHNKVISKGTVIYFCVLVFFSFSIVRESINALIGAGGDWSNLGKHYKGRVDLAIRVLYDGEFWIRDNRYRSFLQCIPYAIPALLLLKFDSQKKIWLTIPIIVLGIIFVTVGDFGVVTPNPRYLLPVLPFVAVLTAALLQENKKFLLSKQAYAAITISTAFILALFLLNSTQGYFFFAGKMAYYISHIILVATIIASAILFLVRLIKKEPDTQYKKAFLGLVVFSILWTGLTMHMVDYPLLRKNLKLRYDYHKGIAQSFPEHSAVLLSGGPHNGNTLLFIYDEYGKDLVVGQITYKVSRRDTLDFIAAMMSEGRRVFITESNYNKWDMLKILYTARDFPHEELYLNFKILELGLGAPPLEISTGNALLLTE